MTLAPFSPNENGILTVRDVAVLPKML